MHFQVSFQLLLALINLLCIRICVRKISGAALAFLMHVNDFGYKLQSLYFYLLTTEFEKKENTQWKGQEQQLLSLGSQSQLLQI